MHSLEGFRHFCKQIDEELKLQNGLVVQWDQPRGTVDTHIGEFLKSLFALTVAVNTTTATPSFSGFLLP